MADSKNVYVFIDPWKSSTGIDKLKKAVQFATSELMRDGTISRKTCDSLEELFGNGPESPVPWFRMWFHDETADWLDEINEPKDLPEIDDLKPDKKAAALEELQICSGKLQRERRKLLRQEKVADEIRLQCANVPDRPIVERVQRYETNLKRERDRTIDRLISLKRWRRGEALPPTVNVNVAS